MNASRGVPPGWDDMRREQQDEPVVPVTLVVYWRTEHTVNIPESKVPWGTPSTWDEVMAFVEADPELGDVDSGTASVNDWEMNR